MKHYFLMAGIAALTFLTGCDTKKGDDLVADNFEFADKQLRHALVAVDEARTSESEESRERREKRGWGELTNPRNNEPDGSLNLVVSRDWTSGFFPASYGICMSIRANHSGRIRPTCIQD